ncbi:MAG: DNA repair protein RecO [Prevotella sp.]|nr:DNA repair protein RecO [Prevotella sp.]
MFNKARCIVLRTVKFGDNKLIIDFLSRDNGRISAVWNISTSKKAKVRRQYFQPMAILDVDLESSPRSQMMHIREAHIATAYNTMHLDGSKMALAFFTAEFLHYATRDLRSDPLLYDFTEQSMTWLDASDKGIANFHLMFMMRISLFLGFQPDMSSYREGSLFDLREGCFCTATPLHNDYLKVEDAKKMQTLMRMSASNLHLFPLSHNERNRIIDFILLYYRLHIPQFVEMKTLEVLREL